MSFIRKITKAVLTVPANIARGVEDAILDVTDPKEKK
jgi:hypothetical protein